MLGGRTQWRSETGPGYDLRQYVRRRPTGLVAVVRPADSVRDAISGPDAWLLREPNHVVIEEHRDQGATRTGLRIPLRSCTGMTIDDEPDRTLVRLTLTARVGDGASLRLSLRFHRPDRWFLRELAAQVNGGRQPVAPERTDVLPLLEVEQAPDDEDWVVFRAGPSSDEILRGRP
jgi:hypothetical protein